MLHFCLLPPLHRATIITCGCGSPLPQCSGRLLVPLLTVVPPCSSPPGSSDSSAIILSDPVSPLSPSTLCITQCYLLRHLCPCSISIFLSITDFRAIAASRSRPRLSVIGSLWISLPCPISCSPMLYLPLPLPLTVPLFSLSLSMPVPISPSLTIRLFSPVLCFCLLSLLLLYSAISAPPDTTCTRAHTQMHAHPCSLPDCGLGAFYFGAWCCCQIE